MLSLIINRAEAEYPFPGLRFAWPGLRGLKQSSGYFTLVLQSAINEHIHDARNMSANGKSVWLGKRLPIPAPEACTSVLMMLRTADALPRLPAGISCRALVVVGAQIKARPNR